MPTTVCKKILKHLRLSDLRGLAELATQATIGATRITEGVHQSVWETLGMPGGPGSGQTRGLTGLVYKGVYEITQRVGSGTYAALGRLETWRASDEEPVPSTPQRDAFLAVLNGVLGHSLAATSNPLATPMTLRYRGEALRWEKRHDQSLMSEVSSKMLLMIHGLCSTDLQWQTTDTGYAVGHGERLASALGYTPVYLRYNSGLHISQNGRMLSNHLEKFAAGWPTPLDEVTVLAHSMGGLLIRSAVYYAHEEGLRWPSLLKNIVFLGTPHHGAPLERMGNRVDDWLASMPYSAPFTRLGHLRSAGITDLRYGYLLDDDWQGSDRFRRCPDDRQHLPLPEGIACYTIAATTSAHRSSIANRLTGDGLVPLHSALGHHLDTQRTLTFPKTAQWIAYGTNHIALLHSPDVNCKIMEWLTPS